MEVAFDYARAQMLGLTFEPFNLTTGGTSYAYAGQLAWLLRLLPSWAGHLLFVRLVEVS